MGTREVTSKESRAAQWWFIIFLLFGNVHLVTSQLSDDEATAAPPCPPSLPQLPYSSMNSCPDHLITKILDGLTCTPPSVAPPHDGGDLNPVTSAKSDQELSSCPNSCRNHLSTDAISCIPSPPPPPQDGGDLMANQELSTATLTEAVVLALLTANKEERTQWEILFVLIFPSAVFAVIFCEIPLGNMCPRFAQIIERFVVIFFVNAVIALRLPSEFLWVPAVCCAFALLTLIVVPWMI